MIVPEYGTGAVTMILSDTLGFCAASSALTGEQCSPNFISWNYDTYMLAKSTGGAMVKAGGNSWFFLTADYAFGKQLQAGTTSFVVGTLVGVTGDMNWLKR